MTRPVCARRLRSGCRAAAAGLVGVVAIAPLGPANAGCPGTSGTLPFTEASVIAIGQGDAEPYRTIYVDDRDATPSDIPEDSNEGLFVYAESNGWARLQRGGESAAAPYLPEHPPYVEPIVVLPPDPSRPVAPHGLTLFPNGFGGSGLYEPVGPYDDCIEYGGENQPAEPDTLVF